MDHFINFFMPVYRYRCGSLGCSWEGNLRVKRYPPLILPSDAHHSAKLRFFANFKH